MALRKIICLMLLGMVGCTPQQDEGKLSVSIGNTVFNLELSLTPDTRFQGLSDRKHIDENGGMLFVFPKAKHRTFVMRKCYVPIDIIFLDPGKRVVAMHQMSVVPYDTPESELALYPSHWPAMYAIELAGGTLTKLKLKSGNKIPFDLPNAVKQQVQ